jgi:oligopeptide/dipeptide ABC transporter ATP-binding protein
MTAAPQTAGTLLSVRDLAVAVRTREGEFRAVDRVSLDVGRGETLGLVGESGSGKSLTALAIIGLHPRPAARIAGGSVVFDGRDLTQMPESELRALRGSRIGMVLQDPNSALNPLLTVRTQVGEPLRQHRHVRRRDLDDEATKALELLRVSDARRRLRSYPHQLSGGIKQRVVTAAALAGGPSLLIADEPTTALDVTIQVAFLAHLRDVQREVGIGVLMITHDFGVVAGICDRVGVMYASRIVEIGTVLRVTSAPAHPYTVALLRSSPEVRSKPDRLVSIPGQPPPLAERPTGCAFHTRCSLYRKLGEPARCRAEEPALTSDPSGHMAACHFKDSVAADAGTP